MKNLEPTLKLLANCSFYCAVERLDDPLLVGKPLAVRQFNSGGFVAVSYEVRGLFNSGWGFSQAPGKHRLIAGKGQGCPVRGWRRSKGPSRDSSPAGNEGGVPRGGNGPVSRPASPSHADGALPPGRSCKLVQPCDSRGWGLVLTEDFVAGGGSSAQLPALVCAGRGEGQL